MKGRRRQRWPLIAVTTILLALATVAAAARLLSHYVVPVDVAVETLSIHLASRRGATDVGSPLGILTAILGAAEDVAAPGFDVGLRVRNDSVFSCRLLGARYQIALGDREIDRGEWRAPGGALAFGRGQDVHIRIGVQPELLAGMASTLDAVQRRQLAVTIRGDVTVHLVLGRLTLPFEVRSLAHGDVRVPIRGDQR